MEDKIKKPKYMQVAALHVVTILKRDISDLILVSLKIRAYSYWYGFETPLK